MKAVLYVSILFCSLRSNVVCVTINKTFLSHVSNDQNETSFETDANNSVETNSLRDKEYNSVDEKVHVTEYTLSEVNQIFSEEGYKISSEDISGRNSVNDVQSYVKENGQRKHKLKLRRFSKTNEPKELYTIQTSHPEASQKEKISKGEGINRQAPNKDRFNGDQSSNIYDQDKGSREEVSDEVERSNKEAANEDRFNGDQSSNIYDQDKGSKEEVSDEVERSNKEAAGEEFFKGKESSEGVDVAGSREEVFDEDDLFSHQNYGIYSRVLVPTVNSTISRYFCKTEDEEGKVIVYGAKAWTFDFQTVNLTLTYPTTGVQETEYIVTGFHVVLLTDGNDCKGFINSGGILRNSISLSFISSGISSLFYEFQVYGTPRYSTESEDRLNKLVYMCN